MSDPIFGRSKHVKAHVQVDPRTRSMLPISGQTSESPLQKVCLESHRIKIRSDDILGTWR